MRHLPGQLLRALVWRTAPVLALAGLIALALLLRAESILRRLARRRPRLVWGPDPIISIKYWSQALRARGYESTTCVYNVYAIHTREDFDRHRDEFLPRFTYGDLYRDYAIFAWALRSADVFMFFLNGGFLRWTPLRNREAWLLRLAGRRLVVFPYGGDIAVPGHLGPAEEALLRDYPEFVETAEAVTERVDYFARWADVMIRNYQYGYLPRADILWPTMLAIDTAEWSEAPVAATERDGGSVVIVHAPNHRHIKGTARLIEVVEELRSEGVAIELDLIEGRPNHEVRAAVRSADIVGDQFIAGYAMFAIEGMATGKPVLSALAWMDPEVRETEALRACPIVDTDLETAQGEAAGARHRHQGPQQAGSRGPPVRPRLPLLRGRQRRLEGDPGPPLERRPATAAAAAGRSAAGRRRALGLAPLDHRAQALAVGNLGPEAESASRRARCSRRGGSRTSAPAGRYSGSRSEPVISSSASTSSLDRRPHAGADVEGDVGRIALQRQHVGPGDVVDVDEVVCLRAVAEDHRRLALRRSGRAPS